MPCRGGVELLLEVFERSVSLLNRLLDGSGRLPAALGGERLPVEGVVPYLGEEQYSARKLRTLQVLTTVASNNWAPGDVSGQQINLTKCRAQQSLCARPCQLRVCVYPAQNWLSKPGARDLRNILYALFLPVFPGRD